MERNHSAPKNRSWRNHGGSPASVGLQACAWFVGDFSWGNATASMGHIMSLCLGDLTAGTSLLLSCPHFPAVNCVPGCMLTKPSDPVKGCLSPGEDRVRSCGGVSHPHHESRLKKSLRPQQRAGPRSRWRAHVMRSQLMLLEWVASPPPLR